MTEIYFVRHAQPDFRVHDDYNRPLSEKGAQDCALVDAYLADKGISAIYSSPYRRAHNTIAGFAQTLGIDIVCVDGFCERRVAEGWIEDFDQFYRRQWADFDFKLPGGESLREVQARNIAALNEVLSDCAGKSVAIGSHGTALSAIINHYDASFGVRDFEGIAGLMPWIVHFTFDGARCIGIEMKDVFSDI